jgi:hypothetical protein
MENKKSYEIKWAKKTKLNKLNGLILPWCGNNRDIIIDKLEKVYDTTNAPLGNIIHKQDIHIKYYKGNIFDGCGLIDRSKNNYFIEERSLDISSVKFLNYENKLVSNRISNHLNFKHFDEQIINDNTKLEITYIVFSVAYSSLRMYEYNIVLKLNRFTGDFSIFLTSEKNSPKLYSLKLCKTNKKIYKVE